MKFASLKVGRDGRLLLVSRDLRRALAVPEVASTLQQLLDRWEELAHRLEPLYDDLNRGDIPGSIEFDPEECASPLPRAYQWADGSAYVNHVELVRRARGAALPQSFWHDPLIYQGGSDRFLGPRDDIAADPSWGIDFEAEVAVITDDVRQGTGPEEALGRIRLLMLVNDVSLRGLIPAELEKGFGFFQSKPASAFSPVAVTPDELGACWRGGKLHRSLLSDLNDRRFGQPKAGEDMTFHFGQLIAHVAKTRSLEAGSIVGSGTVSNRQGDGRSSAIADGGLGYSCIAEVRMIETLLHGKPRTSFMQPGDRIRIEMLDDEGRSIFGRIDQRVVAIGG